MARSLQKLFRSENYNNHHFIVIKIDYMHSYFYSFDRYYLYDYYNSCDNFILYLIPFLYANGLTSDVALFFSVLAPLADMMNHRNPSVLKFPNKIDDESYFCFLIAVFSLV